MLPHNSALQQGPASMLAQGLMPLIDDLQTDQFYDVMAYWDQTTNTTSVKLIAWRRDQEHLNRNRDGNRIEIDPQYIEPWVQTNRTSTGYISFRYISFLPYIRPFLARTGDNDRGRPVELLHFSLKCYEWNSRTHSRPAYLDSRNRYIQLNYRIRPCPTSLMSSTSPVVLNRYELVMRHDTQLIYFRGQGTYQFRDSSNNFYYVHWQDPRFKLSDRGREELVRILNNIQTYTVPGRTIRLLGLQDQEEAQSTEVYHLVYHFRPLTNPANELLRLLRFAPTS